MENSQKIMNFGQLLTSDSVKKELEKNLGKKSLNVILPSIPNVPTPSVSKDSMPNVPPMLLKSLLKLTPLLH